MSWHLSLPLSRQSMLVTRFGVTHLLVPDSTACPTSRPSSDVDVVVCFDGPAASERFFGVQFCLDGVLGRPVDGSRLRSLDHLRDAVRFMPLRCRLATTRVLRISPPHGHPERFELVRHFGNVLAEACACLAVGLSDCEAVGAVI